MNKSPSTQARDLDKVIHEKTRLDILTTLVAHPQGIQFTDLKTLNDLTDGNLNRHLKVLADADLIQSKKANRGRNAKTTYSMTRRGLSAFENYLDQLEAVLQRAHQATAKTRKPAKRIAIE